MGLENVARCQHIKVNGTQCGSPALRSRRHCFFHNRMMNRRKRFAAESYMKPRPIFSMCLVEDANSLQVALNQVLLLIGSGQMDNKTAGLMLYGLQTASANLRYTSFEAEEVTDVVIDRDTVDRTCIHGPQWVEEDYDDEQEQAVESENEGEAEKEGEAAGEEIAAAALAKAEAASQAPEKPNHVSMEEARMQVRGVVRNWLLEMGETAGASPGQG
jgi:hypothetical protein